MNKKLLSLAVGAALSAAPLFAQADVVVYGQLQMELADVEADALTTDNMVLQNGAFNGTDARIMDDNKRGRLGVKAAEKLGNGMTAIAKFEWQVDTSDANSNDGSRESYVGLKGGWGTFTAGALKSAYKYTGGVKYDPFVTTYLEARRHGGMSFGRFGHNSFMNDSLGYEGKFGGVHVWATYSPDESNIPAGGGNHGNVDDGDYTASLAYNAGNWEAFVATAHNEGNALAGSVGDYDAWKVGGKFKFGNNTFLAQYENLEDDSGAVNEEGEIWFLGYHLQFGNNTFVAQYGNGTTEFQGGANDQESDYYALGVIHKMSKKTRVFAGYADTDVENAGGTAGSDGDYKAATIGLRVDF